LAKLADQTTQLKC